MPSTRAVHGSPRAIGFDSVNVPVLTISPAVSGSMPERRAIAVASFAETERRTAQHVSARAFLDELVALEQPDRESRELIDERGNRLGRDAPRLAHDQRGAKSEGRDEIDRLELPVGEPAVHDLEAEPQPPDPGKDGRG